MARCTAHGSRDQQLCDPRQQTVPPCGSHLAVEEGQRGKGRPEGRQQLERAEWHCGRGRKPRHRALPAPLLVGGAAGGAAAGVELLGGGELALAAWLQGRWHTGYYVIRNH